jgi:hypothetical protein
MVDTFELDLYTDNPSAYLACGIKLLELDAASRCAFL